LFGGVSCNINLSVNTLFVAQDFAMVIDDY
jgi:hypothetical protein